MSPLLVLVFTGLALYAIRASFLVTAGRFRLPVRVQAALGHARPAVLAALLVTILTGGDGPAGIADPTALVVTGVAVVVSMRAGMITTVLAGLVAIAVLGTVAA